MKGAIELVKSIKKRNDLHAIYDAPEAESTLKLVGLSILWTPYIVWKLRQMKNVKAKRFWFTNRNNDALEGVMYGLNDNEQRPIVAYDCGYKRGRSNFPMIGKLLACLGYRSVSILSREELKAGEGDDYTDALAYLRKFSQYKQLFGAKTAFVVISGGGNVLYRSCSSQDFVDQNQVVCGVSVATYGHLDTQFAHMKKVIDKSKTKPSIMDRVIGIGADIVMGANTMRVLSDYNDYAVRIGLTPDADPKVFADGSPVTYAPEMKVPVMLLHGVDDPIVPAEGSIEIFKAMRAVGKRAKLVLTPGEGVHGDPKRWDFRSKIFSVRELAGVLASLGYAYRYLRNRFND